VPLSFLFSLLLNPSSSSFAYSIIIYNERDGSFPTSPVGFPRPALVRQRQKRPLKVISSRNDPFFSPFSLFWVAASSPESFFPSFAKIFNITPSWKTNPDSRKFFHFLLVLFPPMLLIPFRVFFSPFALRHAIRVLVWPTIDCAEFTYRECVSPPLFLYHPLLYSPPLSAWVTMIDGC